MKLETQERSVQTELSPAPSDSFDASDASDAFDSPSNNIHELPLQVPTLTNSPRCAPTRSSSAASPAKPATPRRVRKTREVRVDAWAVPASTNWSRTRTTVRKVDRSVRATDWSLPF